MAVMSQQTDLGCRANGRDRRGVVDAGGLTATGINPANTSRGATPNGSVSEDAHVTSKSCFFICHTLRCGSTLLCDALSSTGVAGSAEEYFPERWAGGAFVATGAALKDADAWRADWTSIPFQQCLDRALRSGTTPNGVFASKLKWGNMPYLSEMLGALPERGGLSLAEHLDSLFPNLRYVWVTRRNKIRQAVSLVKAMQSNQWKGVSAQPQGSEAAHYNFHVVDLALRRIVREEAAWEEYFTHAGIAPVTVVYEDLVRNYESTVRRLLDHLKIHLPREYVFPVPRLHKQADAVSDEWVERYHRDARSSRTWRTIANLPPLLVRRRLRETYVLPRLPAHH
jgi:LPS sulfotransferase NodH